MKTYIYVVNVTTIHAHLVTNQINYQNTVTYKAFRKKEEAKDYAKMVDEYFTKNNIDKPEFYHETCIKKVELT